MYVNKYIYTDVHEYMYCSCTLVHTHPPPSSPPIHIGMQSCPILLVTHLVDLVNNHHPPPVDHHPQLCPSTCCWVQQGPFIIHQLAGYRAAPPHCHGHGSSAPSQCRNVPARRCLDHCVAVPAACVHTVGPCYECEKTGGLGGGPPQCA